MVYQSGDTALLPCDVSVPNTAAAAKGNNKKGSATSSAASVSDELRLIMWYREDVKSPIYRDGIRQF